MCDELIPLVGCPAFPYIDHGKAGVTTKGKRKKEREIRLPEVRRPPLRVGPADPVDHGGSGVVPGVVLATAAYVRASCAIRVFRPIRAYGMVRGSSDRSHAGG